MEKPEPKPRVWHITVPAMREVSQVQAARIAVTDAGALLFLDSSLELFLALAPGAWHSVERVCDVEDPVNVAALE